jgi:hypothetical protein
MQRLAKMRRPRLLRPGLGVGRPFMANSSN